jgi:hypothetical protein
VVGGGDVRNRCKVCDTPLFAIPHARKLRAAGFCQEHLRGGKLKKSRKKRERHQCNAITKKGTRCRIWANIRYEYCKVHRKSNYKLLAGKKPKEIEERRKCNATTIHGYWCDNDAVAHEKYCLDHLDFTKYKAPKYKEYIKSNRWKKFIAPRAREAAGQKCQLCNQNGKLHVHHRHYDNLGFETYPKDLTVLCGVCHNNFHKITGKPRDYL